MGKWVRVSLPVLVAALAATAPSAFARCPSAASVHVLAQNADAMVYERKYTAVYGCLRRSGRPHRLNRPSEFGGFVPLDTFRFAGHFVAFQEDFESAAGFAQYWVAVRNLRTGAIHSESQISERGGDYGDESEVLVLKRNGSVAWLAETGPEDDEHAFFREVHVVDLDHQGRVRHRMLDQYRRIGRNSLRMTRDRGHVTWLHGTTRRAATFR